MTTVAQSIAALVAWYERQPTWAHRALGRNLTFESATAAGWFDATDTESIAEAIETHGDEPREPLQREQYEAIEETTPWHSWDEFAAALRAWQESRPEIARDGVDAIRAASETDAGSHTQVIRDEFTRYSGGDAETFAREYAARLPSEWQSSILVCLEPGEPVTVVRWTPERVSIMTTRAWTETENGRRENRRGDPHDPDLRWRVLDDYEVRDAKRVAIPPARAAATRTLSEFRSATHAGGSATPTGIESLDSMIRLGGTSPGALIVLVAREKQCKTFTMLQVAEYRSGVLGRVGIWVALDESTHKIQARRWQHRGQSEREAGECVTRGEHVNDALHVGTDLDMALELAAGTVADGTPVDLYLDSLHAAATGTHELDALVRRLKATGATVFVTAEGTAPRQGETRVKGSTGAAFAADLTLGLSYDAKASTLTLRVARSRIANDGEAVVHVDTAAQRLLDPPASSPNASASAARLRTAVVELLRERGPLSLRGIRERVTGGHHEIADALRAAVERGEIVHDGKKYALPVAA